MEIFALESPLYSKLLCHQDSSFMEVFAFVGVTEMLGVSKGSTCTANQRETGWKERKTTKERENEGRGRIYLSIYLSIYLE